MLGWSGNPVCQTGTVVTLRISSATQSISRIALWRGRQRARQPNTHEDDGLTAGRSRGRCQGCPVPAIEVTRGAARWMLISISRSPWSARTGRGGTDQPGGTRRDPCCRRAGQQAAGGGTVRPGLDGRARCDWAQPTLRLDELHLCQARSPAATDGATAASPRMKRPLDR